MGKNNMLYTNAKVNVKVHFTLCERSDAEQGRGRAEENKYVRQTKIFEHLQLILRVAKCD